MNVFLNVLRKINVRFVIHNCLDELFNYDLKRLPICRIHIL